MAFDNIPLGPKSSQTSYQRSKLRARLQRMRAGIAAKLKPGQALLARGGKTVARELLLLDLDAALATFQASDDLALKLAVQRQQEQELLPQVYDALGALQDSLHFCFGAKNPVLTHFGLKPRRARRKATPAEQLEAVVRRRETRKNRGTLGKNQKKKLKAGPVKITVKTSG